MCMYTYIFEIMSAHFLNRKLLTIYVCVVYVYDDCMIWKIYVAEILISQFYLNFVRIEHHLFIVFQHKIVVNYYYSSSVASEFPGIFGCHKFSYSDGQILLVGDICFLVLVWFLKTCLHLWQVSFFHQWFEKI